MKEMKGIATVAIAAVIIVVIIGAVAAYVYLIPPEEEEPEKVTITVWHRFEEEEASVYEAFIETFESEHPNIEVNFEFIPGELMWDKVVTSIAGGAGPDLFEWAHDWTGRLAEGEYIVPIDEFATTEIREKFVASALKAGEYEGNLYGLPWAAETMVFAYNNELMGDRPIPGTTDELVALMAEFKEEEIYGASYPINTYTISAWIHAFGGYFWDDETKTIGVNIPETKQAVEWLVETFKPYMYEDLGWDAQVALFPEGQAPLAINGPWMFGSWDGAGIDYTLTTFPKISELGADPMPFTGVREFWINTNSEHSEEAFAFLEWFTTDLSLTVTRSTSFGYIPVLEEVLERPEIVGNPKIGVVANQVALGTPMPVGTEMGAVWVPFEDAVKAIWAETKDIDTALADALAEIEEAIAEM